MQKYRTALSTACLLLFAVGCLVQPEASAAGVRQGLTLCAQAILPGLFPFFILANLWTALRPGASGLQDAWLLGAVGGYPIGAKTIAELHRSGQLTKQQAEQGLLVSCCAGPAFAIGIIGGRVFQSISMGLLVYVIHLSSSVLLGKLLAPQQHAHPHPSTPEIPLAALFTESCRKATETTLHVCGYVLLFCILTEHLKPLLSVFSPLWMTLLLGLLELTGGIWQLGAAGLSNETALVVACLLLGWGGLCVHLQTAACLIPAGLSPHPYLLGKALHSFLSAALACLLLPLLHTLGPYAALTAAAGILPLVRCLPGKSSSGKTAINQI